LTLTELVYFGEANLILKDLAFFSQPQIKTAETSPAEGRKPGSDHRLNMILI